MNDTLCTYHLLFPLPTFGGMLDIFPEIREIQLIPKILRGFIFAKLRICEVS